MSTERIKNAVRLLWIVAITCLFLGVYIAVQTSSGYWLDRFGKVIVICSLFMTYYQFRYEVKNHTKPEVLKNEIANEANFRGFSKPEVENIVSESLELRESKFEVDRKTLILHTLFVAGCGEFIAAFGNVTYSFLLGKI
jgi:hypothetical protein